MPGRGAISYATKAAYPVPVFRRSDSSAKSTDESTDDVVDATGKGHATPKRRDAEAARKQALKVPADPKAAKRAMRDRERQARQEQRSAMMRGDERALPARDQGPVRAFVRDWVDSRRLMGEFFIPIAILVLVFSLVPNRTTQVLVSYAWFAMLLVVIADTAFLVYRLRKAMSAQFPDPAERKGATLYGVMRALQIRKLRLPPPKYKAGGRPVPPKKPKASKG